MYESGYFSAFDHTSFAVVCDSTKLEVSRLRLMKYKALPSNYVGEGSGNVTKMNSLYFFHKKN